MPGPFDASTPDPETALVPQRRCTALSRTSGYKERCRKRPIRGASVCREHGGAAKQVRRKAQERLDRASDHMAAFVIRCVHDAEDNTCPRCGRLWVTDRLKIALRAAIEVLNRTGIGPTFNVKVGKADGETDTRIVDWFTPEEGLRWFELAEEMKAIEEAAKRRMDADQRPDDQTAPPVVVEGVLMLPEPEAKA